MIDRKRSYMVLMIGIAILSAIFDGLYYWFNLGVHSATGFVGSLLFIVALVLWVDADSKEHPEIARPFDFRFLIYLTWPLYLPYYLWRTRRFKGLLMLAGFFGLFLLGWFVKMLLFFYQIWNAGAPPHP